MKIIVTGATGNIVYATSKLRVLGFKEKFDFEMAIKKAVEKVIS